MKSMRKIEWIVDRNPCYIDAKFIRLIVCIKTHRSKELFINNKNSISVEE